MTVHMISPMNIPTAAILVLLGTMGTGCVRNPAPITWEAGGVRVAELDLPLSGDGVSFKVGEYLLEGWERSGGVGRQFNDRLLLTADLRGSHGLVFGYIHRAYRHGGARVLRLHGRVEPPAGDPDVIVVLARSYPVESDGTARAWSLTETVELRLNSASAHVSARGF
jgi:hypothetical protein